MVEEVLWHWQLEEAGLFETIVACLATIQRFLGEVKEQQTQDCAFSTHQYQGIVAGIHCTH
jgi:hypothetical protein